MRWVTRKGAKVDRIACPWLIKRFIDDSAEFLFVPQEEVEQVVGTEQAIPFDVPGARFGHHGDRCSFDALVEGYGLQDRGFILMAEIVRGADTEMVDPPPESAGLRAIALGFSRLGLDDRESLRRQIPLYDALFEYCGMRASER
jgi:hypothetical protein